MLKSRRKSCVFRNEMDEYQLSCPESMFKIHKFKTEEEAKALGKISKSGTYSHVNDEYWVAEESLLTNIFDESVEVITQIFKINVPLGVEWQVGRQLAATVIDKFLITKEFLDTSLSNIITS